MTSRGKSGPRRQFARLATQFTWPVTNVVSPRLSIWSPLEIARRIGPLRRSRTLAAVTPSVPLFRFKGLCILSASSRQDGKLANNIPSWSTRLGTIVWNFFEVIPESRELEQVLGSWAMTTEGRSPAPTCAALSSSCGLEKAVMPNNLSHNGWGL